MKLSAIAALAVVPLSALGVNGCTTWEAQHPTLPQPTAAQILQYENNPPTVAQIEQFMTKYAVTNAELAKVFPTDPPVWILYSGGYCGQTGVIQAIEDHFTVIPPASCVNGRHI